MVLETQEISTERMVLWVADPAHAPRMLRYHQDNWDHLRRWSPPVPHDFMTLGYWERRLAGERGSALAGRAARWALSRAGDADREVIGTVGLTEIVRGPLGQAYLGYGLAEREQGRGLMTEAVRAVCAYAFESLRLHQIMAGYVPVNEASGRVLRRSGFDVVGYIRDHLYVDGAWRDHILTVLIEPTGRPPADRLQV
jgi:[ribosomal protein S5]-alanine N-acetyltransferase